MRTGDDHARRILETQIPRIRSIVATTARRGRQTAVQEMELFSRVMEELSRNDFARLRDFEGTASLATYLTVVVQEIAHEGRRRGAGARELEEAIEQIASSLPAREALVVKMWFERGMTGSKIAAALRMPPGRVHALIATLTDRVQTQLAKSSAMVEAEGEG